MRRRASWILAALVAVLSGCGARHCRILTIERSVSTGRATLICDGETIGHGDKLVLPERKCTEAP